jgi:multimeric flavodoxin WrbA
MSKQVVAIVGSYRKGETIDTAVEAILEGARARGAKTHKIYLIEQHIEFCKNCRRCSAMPGPERGKCAQEDDLGNLCTSLQPASYLNKL